MESNRAENLKPGPIPDQSAPSYAGQTKCWGFFRVRLCPVPTWRGWLAIGLAVLAVVTLLVRSLHPFLAVNAPLPDGLLVVEGWMPDYGMESVIDEFNSNHHDKIYVTGGPLEYGIHLTAYETYAQLGAATLVKMGLSSNLVQAVPAPRVRQDRTYASALVLKKWLIEHGINPTKIYLISEGPHARRSRLLFQKAMGPSVVVGVAAVPSRDYDPAHWWKYSGGVRNVMSEGLAYLYARFLFHPPKT